MIIMDSKAQLTADIIVKVATGKMDIVNAAKLINKSCRTTERYLKKYRQVGIQFIVHQNTGRSPVNKSSDEVKRVVQALIKEKYFDVNLCHLKELLEEHEQIQVKRETLRSWAHEIHHVKRAKRRRSQIRKRRERMESSGLMLQMDGSSHRWFGNEKSCLIAIIDDATSAIHAEFFEAETTLGCLKVLRDYIAAKGVFKVLYVDKAGIFGGPRRCNFSQVQRACKELGIEIIFANSPQGKGRVERSFDTFQDRLIPELRLNKINDMDSANNYLQGTFIPQFWDRNIKVIARNNTAEFTAIPQHLNLDDVCVMKDYRKIRSDHTFSYGNKFYSIDSPLKRSIAKQLIEIRTADREGFTAYFAGRELAVSEVIEPTKPSMFDLDIQKKLDVLTLADELDNVSEAARISGVSRDTIYRHRRILKENGPEGLKRQITKHHHHKNRADKTLEKTVMEFSLHNPHLGQSQVSRQIKKVFRIDISPSGVRGIWLRADMQTTALRVQKSNSKATVS